MRMVDMTQPVMTMTKSSPSPAAGVVTDEARDDPSDPYEAHDAYEQPDPFGVRRDEWQRGEHDTAG